MPYWLWLLLMATLVISSLVMLVWMVLDERAFRNEMRAWQHFDEAMRIANEEAPDEPPIDLFDHVRGPEDEQGWTDWSRRFKEGE
jgi:hypothetical protein